MYKEIFVGLKGILCIILLCCILVGCNKEVSNSIESEESNKVSENGKGEVVGWEEMKDEIETEEQEKSAKEIGLTIKEAQENKKLLSVTHETTENLYVYNEDILFGVKGDVDPKVFGKSSIKQIVGAQIGVVLVNNEGGIWCNDDPFRIELGHDIIVQTYSDAIYATYKWGLTGNRDIIYYKKDGQAYYINDYDCEIKDYFVIKNVEQMEYFDDDGSRFALLMSDGNVKLVERKYGNVHDKNELVDRLEINDTEINVSDWSDIYCIVGSGTYLLGLRGDGKIIATGQQYPEDILNWTDIVDIQISASGVVGLKEDGTIICSKNLPDLQQEVDDYKNIKAFWTHAGYKIIALSEDGCLFGDYMLATEYAYKFKNGKYEKYQIKEVMRENVRKQMMDRALNLSLDYYELVQ